MEGIEQWQFWMNWVIQAVIAIAMLSAVIVALFGEFIKAHLWPPRLSITLQGLGDRPVPTKLTFSDGNREDTLSW